MRVPYHSRRERSGRRTETLGRGSVQVWGENLFYEASGLAESGVAVLFLHEAGGSAATWHGQLTGLAQHARCITLDLPGHGRSEGLGYTSVEAYRAAVTEFLDALALRWPVVVAGVCLGAAIAVDLAVHAPHRVAGLVLSGVSSGGRACPATRDAVSRGETPESFVRGFFSEAVSPRLLRERLKHWRLTSPLVRHGDLNAIQAYPMFAALQAVPHPLMVLAGDQDPIATPAMASSATGAIPGARVVRLPQAGCLGMIEQPALFNRSVVEFLDDLPPMISPVVTENWKTGGYRRF